MAAKPESADAAIARLYDLDLREDPGDVELYRALARRTGGPIVELAAGSGRLAVPLVEDGHEVVGVDLDDAMLDRARVRAADAGPDVEARLHLVEADLLTAATNASVLARGPYRLAIFGLNSILILTSPDQQRASLAVMAELLAPGGLAVVDAWLPSPGDLVAFDGRLSLEWVRTDDRGRDVTKQLSAWYDATRRLVTLTTIFDEGAPGAPPGRWIRRDALRMVTADELADYARRAGLEIEQEAGDYDLSSLDPGSERVVLIARKPG
jgi:SAM-dependent methyltransferase